ncbi:MAG: hypothetical protein ACR2PY_02370 [Salinispira sp.]
MDKAKSLAILRGLIEETQNMSQAEFNKRDSETHYSPLPPEFTQFSAANNIELPGTKLKTGFELKTSNGLPAVQASLRYPSAIEESGHSGGGSAARSAEGLY